MSTSMSLVCLVGLVLIATVVSSVDVVDEACIAEINNCNEESLAVLMKATHGMKLNEYGKDVMENLCRDKEQLHDCLNAADAVCPTYVVEQYQTNLRMVTASCDYIDCTKKITNCGSDVAEMFRLGMTSDPSQYLMLETDGGIDDLCGKIDALKTCISAAEPECSSQVAAWNVQLNAITPICDLLPCSNKIKECFGEFSSDLILPTYDVFTLQSVCSRTHVTNDCIHSISECPTKTTKFYSDAMNTYLSKCITMDACQKSVRACVGESADTFFTAVGRLQFKVSTVEKLCPVKDQLSKCFTQTSSCIDYADQYDATVTTYVKQVCDVMPCYKKLETCMGDVTDLLMSGTGYRTGRLEKLCENEEKIRQCLESAGSTCPRSYIDLQKIYLDDSLRQGCNYNSCVMKVEACNGDVGRIFKKGTDIVAGGLGKLCDEKEAIEACFEGMRPVCPDSYTSSQLAIVAQAQKGCDYISCAQKVQHCGTSAVTDINFLIVSKETFVSFCKNVMKMKVCLDSIGSECSQEVKDKWKGSVKTSADRCATIVKKYEVTEPPTTVGSKVVIELKLEMQWNETYKDLENAVTQLLVANLKNSLTEIYKDTPGFKEVTIVRLFKSSIGVIHTVKYEQELTNKDRTRIGAALMAALRDKDNSLTVGNETFRTVGKPQMQFVDKSYVMDDLCGMYTIDRDCQNGGTCETVDAGAQCVCTGGFHGTYCEDIIAGQNVCLPILPALLVSVAVSVLLGG